MRNVIYVKLHVKFFQEAKPMSVGKDGKLLYLAALCYSRDNLTDGEISDLVLPMLGAMVEIDDLKQTVSKLVTACLWHVVANGYQIHDYFDLNPTADEVREVSEKRAEAGKQGGIAKARREKAKSGLANVQQIAKQKSSKSLAIAETETESLTPSARGAAKEDNFQTFFTTFKELYPRNSEGRKPNMTEAEKLARKIPARDWDLVLSALSNYAVSDKVIRGFVKEPPGFLRGDYWRDYIEPPSNVYRIGNGQQPSDIPPEGYSWEKDEKGKWFRLGRDPATGLLRYGAKNALEENEIHRRMSADYKLAQHEKEYGHA